MTPDHALDAREAGQLEERSAILCLLEASGIALVVLNSAREVTSWSAAAELIFGWNEKEIMGRGISLLAPDGSVEGPLACMHHLRVKHFESSCQTKAGKTVLADIWTCAIPATKQLLIIKDVTEMKFLEHAFLDAAERERRRIGREMHDYLCQHILGAAFAVKALAGDLDREGSRHAEQLHNLARLVNESVTQVRDISRGLDPVELESSGLSAALQGFASRVNRAVPCEFHCDQNASIVETSDPVLHAYRIAQEAVAHALQETGPTKIFIRLSEKDGSIRLDIADNGMKEGPLTTDPDHLVSKTLRYQAQAIKGRLRVKFDRRIGTHVTCTFPRTS